MSDANIDGHWQKHPALKGGKRALDVIASLGLLILLLPLLPLIALLVLMAMGRPLFFTQLRPGLEGRPFRLIKFRSMADRRDADGELLPEVERLGKVGRFLRSTSIDELPELLNVLRGEMSLVGPRPLMMEYLPLYSPEQARRHEVRPGITGLAQVKGRNALGWDEKFALDIWYVDNWSLWLDLKILWWTLFATARRHGVSPAEQEIMPRFEGHGDSANSSERTRQSLL